MRVVNAQVTTVVEHEQFQSHTVEESLVVEFGPRPDAVAISAEAESALESQRPPILGPTVQETLDGLARAARSAQRVDPVEDVDGEGGLITDLELAIVAAVIERMTGRRVQVIDARDLQAKTSSIAVPPGADGATSRTGEAGPTAAPDPDFSLEYHRVEHREDSETLRVKTQVAVETGDGRRVDVDVEVALDRRWVKDDRIDVLGGRAVEKKDPLVVQYGGEAISFQDRTFRFDLDADGIDEELHQPGAGGGFLALDRDGSGSIEDGRELFGPQSNDGFAELRTFDQDGNGWIDEGDDVFARLRVWTRDEAGDHLLGLVEVGVGAIHLGATATPYSFRGADNQELASLRESAVWLGEDEGAGWVHEVDLVV
jgi:hypothetical protein